MEDMASQGLIEVQPLEKESSLPLGVEAKSTLNTLTIKNSERNHNKQHQLVCKDYVNSNVDILT